MLQKANFSTCLVCYKSSKLSSKDIFDKIPIHRFISPEIENVKSFFSIRKKEVNRLIKTYSFKAVWCNDHTMLDIGRRIKKKNKDIFLIYDSHEFFQDYQLEFSDNDSLFVKIKSKMWIFLQRKIERKNSKNIDLLISINDSIANELKKIFKVICPVFSIKNIPDHLMVHEGLELSQEIVSNLEENKKNLNLLYIGNYIKKLNGLETVFYAIKEKPKVRLVILGTTKSQKHFEKIIAKLNIKDQVLVINRQPIELIPSVAKYCQIAVIPTLECGILQNYLSLPNKFFDSIKLSLPIICSNLPEQKKIIEKFNNGVLTNPYSEEKATQDIITAIDKIQLDMDKYNSAAKKANQFYSYQREYDHLINHLKTSITS